MNRIEEAIQKAKVAKAVRDRDAERAAERAAAERATAGHAGAGHDGAVRMPEPAADTRQRGARIEPFPRAGAAESAARARASETPSPALDVATPEVVRAEASAPETPRPPPPEVSALPPLTIDAAELERAGLWPDAAHARRLADEFRVAKRAVLGAFARRRGETAQRRVVAVTSALAGEGKSFASLHLAISFALERGLSVVLVDGDSARPTLSRALGCSESPGLLECLEGSASLDAALRATSVPRLWFLPAGRTELGAAELYSSPPMAQVLNHALARFRDVVVVCDTPPLLLTVEARALVDAATQALLVVKANSTPEGAILQALDNVGEERPVQLLLNQRRESRFDAYQYYYSYPADTSFDAPQPN